MIRPAQKSAPQSHCLLVVGAGAAPDLGTVGDDFVGSFAFGKYGPGVPDAIPVVTGERLAGWLNGVRSSGSTGAAFAGPRWSGKAWA
jgi:hypothetical protein